MAITHSVAGGECLSSIAAAYGFVDYRTIYQHPSNADFRKKRPNPNIIFPGDVLHIPDKELKSAVRPTGKSHAFTVKSRKDKLRVAVRDKAGQPLGDKPYKVTVNGVETTGRTDSSGLVSTAIPPHATSGILHLWMNDDDAGNPALGRDFALSIGALDPADETSGIQARLNNLGYDCGAVDGVLGPATAEALKEFQADNRLSVTGKVDDSTRAKLEQRHDDV